MYFFTLVGPDNQNVSVGDEYFTENCVVLNATGGTSWFDVDEHKINDVNCCQDLGITWAVCERRELNE